MNITFDSKAFKSIMDKLTLVETTIKILSAKNSISKWMEETEVMLLTGLTKSSLRKKRSQGVFTYSTATGRKIKYLRRDVENYLDGNASQTKKYLANEKNVSAH